MIPPLAEWQQRHGVSAEAMIELQRVLTDAVPAAPAPEATGSEAAGQQRIRLTAPTHGVRLWRNNVGACVDERGNHIRYGLANESTAMNRKLKSADLIGITPVTITPAMVGAVLGVFTSIECKRPGWKYKANAREQAQLSWAELILSMGGFAQFATDPADIWRQQ
jgi:hypothetical protein